MRLILWNIARQEEPWHLLATDERIDVALLQEATTPPAGPIANVRVALADQLTMEAP
jgi:hypothetical protein